VILLIILQTPVLRRLGKAAKRLVRMRNAGGLIPQKEELGTAFLVCARLFFLLWGATGPDIMRLRGSGQLIFVSRQRIR